MPCNLVFSRRTLTSSSPNLGALVTPRHAQPRNPHAFWTPIGLCNLSQATIRASREWSPRLFFRHASALGLLGLNCRRWLGDIALHRMTIAASIVRACGVIARHRTRAVDSLQVTRKAALSPRNGVRNRAGHRLRRARIQRVASATGCARSPRVRWRNSKGCSRLVTIQTIIFSHQIVRNARRRRTGHWRQRRRPGRGCRSGTRSHHHHLVRAHSRNRHSTRNRRWERGAHAQPRAAPRGYQEKERRCQRAPTDSASLPRHWRRKSFRPAHERTDSDTQPRILDPISQYTQTCTRLLARSAMYNRSVVSNAISFG